MSEYSGSINDESINGEEDVLYRKGIKAAKKFLVLHGYDVYDVNPDNKVQIIAFNSDDDRLHFIHVFITEDMNFTEPKSMQPSQVEFEKRMISFIKVSEPFKECEICRDQIVIIPVKERKALLRHHQNAYK